MLESSNNMMEEDADARSREDSFGAKENSTIFHMTVLNNAGKTVTINFNVKESFESLQVKIQEECGISLNEQCFSCFPESTLWDGENGFQEAYDDFNQARENLEKLNLALENRNLRNEQSFVQHEHDFDGFNVTICEQNDTVAVCSVALTINSLFQSARVEEAEERQIQVETIEINNSNLPSCNVADFIVNGRIDYEKLNGKVLVGEKLEYSAGKWSLDKNVISFEHPSFKICPMKKVSISTHDNLSYIVNRIICNYLKELCLTNLTITYFEYMKLISSAEICSLALSNVTINDENGVKMEIDELLKETTNIKTLHYTFQAGEVTSETAQRLVELQPFANLSELYLYHLQEGFNLKDFSEFIQKNQIVKGQLNFCCSTKVFKEIKQIWKQLSLLSKFFLRNNPVV